MSTGKVSDLWSDLSQPHTLMPAHTSGVVQRGESPCARDSLYFPLFVSRPLICNLSKVY